MEIVRSEQISWSNNRQVPVDLSFLDQVLGRYTNPEIVGMYLRFVGSITTNGATTFTADDAAKLLSEFRLKDRGGLRVDLDGLGMRIAAQQELGDSLEQPATQAISTTNASYELTLPIIWNPKRAYRPRDFCPHVLEFTSENGGSAFIKMCGTNPITGVTVDSGTWQLFVEIQEGGSAEPGSRMCWLRESFINKEASYDAKGLLRYFIAYAADDDGTGYEAWSASSYAEVDSESLGIYDMPLALLRQESLRQYSPASDDVLKAGTALAFATPKLAQKSIRLADHTHRKVHIRLATAPPAGAQLLKCVITDRAAGMAEQITKVPANEIVDRANSGRVSIATGKGKRDLRSVAPAAAAKLPIRVA